MKRISARILFVAIGTASCALMFYFSWVRVHAVEGVTCTFDATLSQSTQQRIIARAHELNGSLPDALIFTLTEEFPCIATIGLQLQPNNHARIAIGSQTPIMRVNESSVLTQSARLVDQSDFDAQLISKLFFITVAPEVAADAQQLKELQRTCAHIDPTLFTEFNVHWRNAHEVQLVEYAESRMQFVCCGYQLENKARMHAYRAHVAQLIQERSASAPQKKQWVADLRFENQIILRGPTTSNFEKNIPNGSKGGIHHGTCLS